MNKLLEGAVETRFSASARMTCRRGDWGGAMRHVILALAMVVRRCFVPHAGAYLQTIHTPKPRDRTVLTCHVRGSRNIPFMHMVRSSQKGLLYAEDTTSWQAA